MPKVILISGGSDGLGKNIAQKLVPNHHVVILAHNKAKVETVAKEIGCDFVDAELTDFNSLKSAIDQVITKYKNIDVLINNAGVWVEGNLIDNSPEKIKEVIDVNTVGTIYLTKAVLPQLLAQKSGQIINIVSQDGLTAKKDRSVYHASKWAITGFTKCLQEDLTESNIKVTGIYPGLLKTSLFAKNGVERDLSAAMDPAEIAILIEFIINLNPNIFLPEVGIKNLLNITKNMDDTNNMVGDLNLDPNMMTTQNSSPQATVSTSSSNPSPTVPSNSSGIIDITPGVSSSSVSNTSSSPTTASVPNVSLATPVADLHLTDFSPPITVTTSPTTSNVPPITTIPLAPPPMQSTVTPSLAPDTSTTSNPLAEDPDLVILQK